MSRLKKDYLRRLRNEIPIRSVIADILAIPWKIAEARFRFLCPRCGEFDTATDPRTNLARCFRCHVNFNPIDIVMIDKHLDFLQAVEFLHPCLSHHNDTSVPSTLQPPPHALDQSIRDP